MLSTKLLASKPITKMELAKQTIAEIIKKYPIPRGTVVWGLNENGPTDNLLTEKTAPISNLKYQISSNSIEKSLKY